MGFGKEKYGSGWAKWRGMKRNIVKVVKKTKMKTEKNVNKTRKYERGGSTRA